MAQETALAIVKPENIKTIVTAAPQSHSENAASCERCLAVGQELLNKIQTAGGMNDDLDQQVASYIDKTKKTLAKMNEKRSPLTKLFDDIRKEFTKLENTIDPSKTDTVPYRLQAIRNAYAAQKRAEEERRRREEVERQQAKAARDKFRSDVEDYFKREFQNMLSAQLRVISDMDSAITLDNYEASKKLMSGYSTVLPSDWFDGLKSTVVVPYNIPVSEASTIEADVKKTLKTQFIEHFKSEMQDNIDYYLDRLPSKKANLERIQLASAEEAARLQAEMEERKRREAAEQEAERKRKEEEEQKRSELARQKEEMNNLFAGQVVGQAYTPKVSVTKKIELLNPEGIMAVLGMWWSKEGASLTVEELSKMFKKQITACEKLANKDGIFIEDESIAYVDDIKAR